VGAGFRRRRADIGVLSIQQFLQNRARGSSADQCQRPEVVFTCQC
jgi:hypothetical protein